MNLPDWRRTQRQGQGSQHSYSCREINGYYLEDVYDKTATPPKLLGKKGELCRFLRSRCRRTAPPRADADLLPELYPERRQDHQHDGTTREKRSTGLGMYPEWSWAWPSTGGSFTIVRRLTRRGNPGTEARNHQMGPGQRRSGEQKPGTWVGDVPDGPAPPMATEKGKLPYHDGNRCWRPLRPRAC